MPLALGTPTGREGLAHDPKPSSLSPNEYAEKFEKLHERAVQQIRNLAQDDLQNEEFCTVDVPRYAARRKAQADKWLKDIMEECHSHATWLAKGFPPKYAKKLEDFEHRLNAMDLYGRFDWVGNLFLQQHGTLADRHTLNLQPVAQFFPSKSLPHS